MHRHAVRVYVFVLGGLLALTAGALYSAQPENHGTARVTVWGPNVVEAEVVHRVSPDLRDLRGRISGVAIVEFWLDERGAVVRAELVTRKPKEIEEAVVAAARAWKFNPASVRGRPVRSLKTITMSFSN